MKMKMKVWFIARLLPRALPGSGDMPAREDGDLRGSRRGDRSLVVGFAVLNEGKPRQRKENPHVNGRRAIRPSRAQAGLP
ncbi:hypothetical protein GCM10011324_32750 [Allosediminivita pacifica]|nr:hypothetical protein GCM10011324_32750 [Allosediminivita pacifica]